MKKAILLFSAVLLVAGTASAQVRGNKTAVKAGADGTVAAPVAGATQAAPVVGEDTKLKFTNLIHDFGTIPEGPAVSFDFDFKNTSKEPVQLEHVQASCGCTTPNWTKDPVLPGKSSKVTATYNTQGRPGNFFKTITVRSSAGTTTLTIKGVVEKAPDASVPGSDNSMIKH